MKDHKKCRVKETAIYSLLGYCKEMIEFAIVVNSEIVGGSLNEEGIVELKLMSFIGGMSNGVISFKFTNISSIVEIDFSFFPAKIVNFHQKSFFFSHTNL